MIRRIFLDHPKAVGETYGQHFRVASGFAGDLMLAALACGVHAVVPSLFERTGSRAVARIHERMCLHRRGVTATVGAAQQSHLTVS